MNELLYPFIRSLENSTAFYCVLGMVLVAVGRKYWIGVLFIGGFFWYIFRLV